MKNDDDFRPVTPEEAYLCRQRVKKLREVLLKAGKELEFIHEQKLTARNLEPLLQEIAFCLGGKI